MSIDDMLKLIGIASALNVAIVVPAVSMFFRIEKRLTRIEVKLNIPL